jgi:hypothetical protein
MRKSLPPAQLTPEEIARIEHDVQILGEADPRGTMTSEGISVQEARERYQRRNDEWEAARLARKTKAGEILTSTQLPTGDADSNGEAN